MLTTSPATAEGNCLTSRNSGGLLSAGRLIFGSRQASKDHQAATWPVKPWCLVVTVSLPGVLVNDPSFNLEPMNLPALGSTIVLDLREEFATGGNRAGHVLCARGRSLDCRSRVFCSPASTRSFVTGIIETFPPGIAGQRGGVEDPWQPLRRLAAETGTFQAQFVSGRS